VRPRLQAPELLRLRITRTLQASRNRGRTGGNGRKMQKPLVIDLFCGLGGWAEGFLAEGYDVIGFNIERHDYGTGGYPGQLVLQDVLTLHGSQFRNAAVIVASPPCQAYSYRAMPWKRAKALPPPSNDLFDACFRISEEAAVPLIVENVRGAVKWVQQPVRWHYGSYYLWGDLPALMPPVVGGQKFNPDGTRNPQGSWFKIADSVNRATKVPPFRFDGSGRSFQSAAVKINGSRRERNLRPGEFGWHKTIMADGTSKSDKRKAASAQIAKSPFDLASHIARCFKPQVSVCRNR